MGARPAAVLAWSLFGVFAALPRYNDTRTLDDFAGQLRQEVELESLGTDLRQVVASTMQPTHVTLWLSDSSRR